MVLGIVSERELAAVLDIVSGDLLKFEGHHSLYLYMRLSLNRCNTCIHNLRNPNLNNFCHRSSTQD